MKHRLPIPVLVLGLALAGCTDQDKTAATATADGGGSVLAADPTQGFQNFQAVGTDGVTSPDCCKVPLPGSQTQDKTQDNT